MASVSDVVLLSGGLDSLLVALLLESDRKKRRIGNEASRPLTVLSVAYGQGDPELYAAARLASHYGWRHIRAKITPFPESLDPAGKNLRPGRNQVFLSLAAAMLPAGGGEIHIGSNADDQADYPDCRPEFFSAFMAMQQIQGRRIWIKAPLVNLHKMEIVTQLRKRGAMIDWTVSCYQYAAGPCGRCNACKLRDAALAESNA